MTPIMDKRQLGNSDLFLTPVGFGAWALGGGGWAFAWGAQDDQASIDAIHRALDHGINWIDTAAVYGLGHSEEVVARALAGKRGGANRPLVFSKCGLVWDETREVKRVMRGDSYRRECEASLSRLQVDVIDLYQVHWPTQNIADIDEAFPALADLQKQGKVRHVGVSNFNLEQLSRARKHVNVVSLQPPYSLLKRDIEAELLSYCARENVGVIGYSPMASGLLTGAMTKQRIEAMPQDDWRRSSSDFNEPKLSAALALVERLRVVGQRHGRSPGEVAIAWTLRRPEITAAIVGARSAEQVDGWIGAGEFRLTPAEVTEIEDNP